MEPVTDDSALGEWMQKARLAIEIVSNKWRLAILHALSTGTLRYKQLHGALERISHKVLAQALRSLERDGLIERKTFPVVPPRVEYSLTPLGRSFVEQFEMLCRWAQEHEREIAASQSSFDEKEKMWSYSISDDNTDSAQDYEARR